MKPAPHDLFWWCPKCHQTYDPPGHRGHGGYKVERALLPLLRRKQAALFLPSEL